MISKELLSEVLNIEIIDYSIDTSQVRINQLWHEDTPLNRELELFNTIYGCMHSINIYELAHKCKEWAYSKHGYLLNSRRTFKTKYLLGYCEVVKDCEFYYSEYSNTEVEAIFKACQWILENK